MKLVDKTIKGFIFDDIEGRNIELLMENLGGAETEKLPQEWDEFESDEGFMPIDIRTFYQISSKVFRNRHKNEAYKECNSLLLANFNRGFFASGIEWKGLNGEVWHRQPGKGLVKQEVDYIPHGEVEQDYDHQNDCHVVRNTTFTLTSESELNENCKSRGLEKLFGVCFGGNSNEVTRILEYYGLGLNDEEREEAPDWTAPIGVNNYRLYGIPEYEGFAVHLPIDRNIRTRIGVSYCYYGLLEDITQLILDFNRPGDLKKSSSFLYKQKAIGIRQAS